MSSAIGRSARQWGKVKASTCPSATAGTSFATQRFLSASIRRTDEQKPPSSESSDSASGSNSTDNNSPASSSKSSSASGGYKPPSRATGSWPFASASDAPEPSSHPSSSGTSAQGSNPYSGLLDGMDAFPTAQRSTLDSSAEQSAAPARGSWLTEQLDSLSMSTRTSRVIGRSAQPNPNKSNSDSGRRKSLVSRSVLFADGEAARRSDDFRPRYPASSPRKRLDRTPLTKQEANAFMSLLNQALAGTSSTSVSATAQGAADDSSLPFGSYTSLISNPKTQTGSKALLQAFAKRNRLQRFEAAKAQRAKRFAREGLAAQIDPLLLEAGIDEARERIAMCENISELLDFAKREVWGIATPKSSREGESSVKSLSEEAQDASTAKATAQTEQKGPKYGKDTPYYASVLQLLFLTLRDRYRAPHVALSLPRVTRSLGIESYVLGVTGSLYNEVIQTQWDWLGDLQGVVKTLRQARETGILSAPLKHASVPASGSRPMYATSEDETIRETVDRIANEVRKFVLDQQMAADPALKRRHPAGGGDFAVRDVLGGSVEDAVAHDEKEGVHDWSHKWLLENADEATALAGQPFRLLQRQASAEADSKGPSQGRGFDRRSPRSERDTRDSRNRSAPWSHTSQGSSSSRSQRY